MGRNRRECRAGLRVPLLLQEGPPLPKRGVVSRHGTGGDRELRAKGEEGENPHEAKPFRQWHLQAATARRQTVMVLSRSSAQEHKAGVSSGRCSASRLSGHLRDAPLGKDSLNVSLSTHLFAFHDLGEAIYPLFPRYGFSLAEIWAMPPHFPSGDLTAAEAVARRMAEHGVRVASVHAPLYPDVRTYKKDRWYSLSSVDEAHRLESVAVTARVAGWLARNGGGTVVLHTSFPAGQWYPHRWGAFLSSMNELLVAVPAGIRFAVENTPVDSGQVGVILDIVQRYPADRVGVCLDLGHAHIEENVLSAVREAAPRLIHVH
ncbi:MAG: L-xylulose 5-phosphate 3-epimerase, partial [Deltaproteobacteria bacterium]|nr:L-xylulose 5-phosphate 3-epimerase [Deltaproteobacteria bacterium]